MIGQVRSASLVGLGNEPYDPHHIRTDSRRPEELDRVPTHDLSPERLSGHLRLFDDVFRCGQEVA